ncbi:MAG TPA: class I SAM-dependent methyltransferase, partial [Candidatus Caenarcaniphilales bacterium]
LAQRFSCQGWGVTPALKQVEYVRQRATDWGLAPLVRVEQAHIQDVPLPAGAFDAITFIESILHIDDKQGLLKRCYRLLKPKGKIYIAESCFRNHQKYQEFSERPGTRFVRDEVFGWGSMVPLSVIVSTLEDAGFSISAMTDLTSHYPRTIQAWMRNIEHNRNLMEAMRPGTADKLLHYLEIANIGWGFTTKNYAVVATKKR